MDHRKPKKLEKKSILYVTLEKRMMIPFPLLRDKSYPHLSFERLVLSFLHSHRLLVDEQKKVSFFTFRLDLDDVKIEFVLEFRNMGV